MRHPARHIFEATPESLAAWCAQNRMPAFRATQILDWLYSRGVADPARMTNLALRDREALARDFTFLSGSVVRSALASDDTRKLLVRWTDYSEPSPASPLAHAHAAADYPSFPVSSADTTPLRILPAPSAPHADTSGANLTECVMIPSMDPSGPRRTACISSQVGCPVGCRFCASGLLGLESNLSAGRIVEQVWRLRWTPSLPQNPAAQPAPDPSPSPPDPDAFPRITNVVFMGMGEPLANLAEVCKAVRTLHALWATGISARKITISTVGLPAAIRRLAADLDLPVTLALSLHAPDDETRRSLIPWAEYTTIAELLDACREWFDRTGREITLEYTLLRGVNDRPHQADLLARVARTLRANVNLIRYNEVPGLPFQRPDTDDVREFQRILTQKGVNAHIRASRGRDIDAACGQLRRQAAAT